MLFFFSPPGCDKRRSCLAPSPSCRTAITASTHQRQGLARTLLGRLCLFLRRVHVGFYVAVGLEGGGRVEGEILSLGQNAASGGEEQEEEELARFQPQKASFRNAAHLRVNKEFLWSCVKEPFPNYYGVLADWPITKHQLDQIKFQSSIRMEKSEWGLKVPVVGLVCLTLF